MNTEIQNTAKMIHAVVGYSETLKSTMPPESRGGKLIEQIAAGDAALRSSALLQVASKGSAKQSVGHKQAAIGELLRQMSVIRKCAIALEPEIPGISRKFVLGGSQHNEMKLVTLARAYIEHATPIRGKFLELETPTTFVEDLEVAIAEVEGASTNKSINRGSQVEGTTGLKSVARETVAKIRQLGAILEARFAKQPAALAEWRSVSRIARPAAKSEVSVVAAQ